MGRKKRLMRAERKKQSLETNGSQINVPLDMDFDGNKYDASNALVLPSKKSEPKVSKVEIRKKKKLSKKQLKKLQNVVQRRQKKASRNRILEEYAKHQITQEELASMTSISEIQTKGLKRFKHDNSKLKRKIEDDESYAEKRSKLLENEESRTSDEESGTSDEESGTSEESDSEDKRLEGSEPSQESSIVSIPKNGLNETLTGKEKTKNESGETLTRVEKTKNGLDETLTRVEKTKNGLHETLTRVEKTKNESGETLTRVEKTKNESGETLTGKEKKVGLREDVEETIFVPVKRDPAIEKWRRSLPVCSEEQSIMEAIRYNDVVVVCGETGSGKTTQIPQFLFEAGYGEKKMICVTEPRRVAAMAMSRRVGHEMNLSTKVVSYHIRYEKNVTNDTKIKFVTDGVLLREVQQDFLLSSYSVILVDEAHERSVFSDVLVGLLSRIVPLRAKKGDPLKLIIMSATLRVDDFVANRKLFQKIPPVIRVESRQFPVTINFLKHTPDNYIDAAFDKVSLLHRTQPPGGILVFVTGRNQVNVLCRKLQNKYPSTNAIRWQKETRGKNSSSSSSSNIVKKETDPKIVQVVKKNVAPKVDEDLFADEDEWDNESDSESNSESDSESNNESDSESINESDSESNNSVEDWIEGDETVSCKEPLYCLPLFSQLPKHRQVAVFDGAPPGHRLVVVATNVAETSLTIPGIRFVVDTGKVKSKVYDETTGVSAFIVTWCSKASAEQRAGRAGRTSPGTCYRLFSSALFNNHFPAFSDPEILTKPVDDLLLQMKSLNVTNVSNFPFPTCPSIEALEASEKRLVLMGALEEVKTAMTVDGKKCNRLTTLGKAMSRFPVSPRFSKMLALTRIDLIPHVVAIISGLTVQEMFLNHTMNENNQNVPKKWNDIRLKWTGAGNEHLLGDIMIILKAIGASEFMSGRNDFHQKIGLRHKAMVEVHKLRRQLLDEVSRLFASDLTQLPDKIRPPNDSDARCLRQLSLAAFFDQVARRQPIESGNKKVKHSYQSIQVESPVYLDHTSVLKETCPEFVVYQEIHEKDSKLFMRNVVGIEPEWLAVFSSNLCHLSDPLEDPVPFYDDENDVVMCHVTGTFGPHCWPLGQTVIPFPAKDDQIFKWFARFLLEGHIDPFFSTYSPKLLTPASLVVKPWAKLQARTKGIISKLSQDRIASLSSLIKKWTLDPTYLLTEYLDWLPLVLHDQVRKAWPPKGSGKK